MADALFRLSGILYSTGIFIDDFRDGFPSDLFVTYADFPVVHCDPAVRQAGFRKSGIDAKRRRWIQCQETFLLRNPLIVGAESCGDRLKYRMFPRFFPDTDVVLVDMTGEICFQFPGFRKQRKQLCVFVEAEIVDIPESAVPECPDMPDCRIRIRSHEIFCKPFPLFQIHSGIHADMICEQEKRVAEAEGIEKLTVQGGVQLLFQKRNQIPLKILFSTEPGVITIPVMIAGAD